MKRDFYSYAKLDLIDTARIHVACNEILDVKQKAEIINSLNEEYVQTINEASGIEFKAAKDMIADIYSSFDGGLAMDMVMEKLFFESYPFQKAVEEFSESEEFFGYFDSVISNNFEIYSSSDEVSFDGILDNINESSKEIATIAYDMNYSME